VVLKKNQKENVLDRTMVLEQSKNRLKNLNWTAGSLTDSCWKPAKIFEKPGTDGYFILNYFFSPEPAVLLQSQLSKPPPTPNKIKEPPNNLQ
jgi:hypothetical protein